MTPSPEELIRVALIGVGATATMDLWLLLLRRAGVPQLDFALIGRWAGHAARGRWRHEAIARAEPVPRERALGWLVHYAVGIGFAGLLVALHGAAWLREPRLLPALCTGVATVLAPWLLMQPAMGAGIAASRTAAPMRNRLRSLANHAVFGVGLYLAGWCIAALVP
ncbi:DUF2938 domain-containing protein [Ramlibacter sp. AN1015]|uniref:DUF2938 domain-containing protein n=1 Tax=Ramlibacter sp. AN1015 TaxID=3133428 RepID=UPI0030C088B4